MIERDNKGRVSFGKWEYFIQALIVLNLIAFAFETLPDIPAFWVKAFKVFEVGTVAIFTIEFLARLLLSRPRLSYVCSFLGIVDLITILPFYLSAGIDLRSVRAFRLFRLVRLFKLVRYNGAVQRLHRAFIIVKEELVLFGGASLIVLYLASIGIFYFERDAQPDKFGSVFQALWWSISTLTTVSYGDVYPITTGGKIFTFFLLLTGMGIIAVPTGLVASALSQAREEERESPSEKI
jgi:voltage-gated potassium channel